MPSCLGKPSVPSPPRQLDAARLVVHHALQIIAIGACRTLLPARDDDSHTALEWDAAGRRWLCDALPTSGLRPGLRPEDLTLTLGDASFPLIGKTREDGLAWLRRQLADAGHDADAIHLDFHYEMPSHPIEAGAPFDDLRDAYAEIAAYFDDSFQLLTALRDSLPEDPVILTWPHHFDMAMLLELGPRADDRARYIGIGMAPGDDHIDQPYLYVTPQPAPDENAALPALPHGVWQRKPFFGAILTAEDWLRGSDAEQQQRASAYLAEAVRGGRALLG
ncbi:MAG: hypothetical protein AAF772_02430 [Acidobacteriota bacterium]